MKGGGYMKLSKIAIKCTKMYMKKAKIPKCFTFNDVTGFKLYLAYRFSFELDNFKPANFTLKEKWIYEDILVYKKFIDEKLFKDVVNYAILKSTHKRVKTLEKEKHKIIKLLKKCK